MSKIILHVVEAPGGVERYLVTLLTKMKKYPEFEHILVCSDSLDLNKFKGIVKNVEVIHTMHNAINPCNDFKSILAVRKQIKKYKPDILYCHSSKAGAIGRVADIGLKNKVIYNAHGWSFNMKGASKKKLFVYKMIEKMLAPITDKIICISDYEKKSALDHKICKSEKLVVINNGIDLDEYKDLKPKSREELGIPKEAFVVGMIGRITPQKAPDVFVKMAALVKQRIPKAFFIIVGDDIGGDQYKQETEQLIESLGMSKNILITGWVDNPLDYADCFDVAVLLSRWEGFGLVLPEYMLLGKPIVGSRADAIPYVVGNAGVLVDIDDYEAAADAVIMLNKDKILRSKIIEKGKQRIKKFDSQITAFQTKDCFMSLC
ncbi:Glycosyltransferase involved in cell wall bisynthesis [Ruminococcus flavefaciens]|uniref:Glycosyltransferase involved in cell wall bisynthesis n=1 Tax=Ruminococcus flavefaciens TaxID=1265 RepID=A0A1H6IJ48_RUMFL|nr:glycosyltransferase family 4 protein [Ruminococcus flavefaciens]SEH46426.1 Glycosyltransferase involved in cell wall bisynthesis [Ruminococcus flavefaciens]